MGTCNSMRAVVIAAAALLAPGVSAALTVVTVQPDGAVSIRIDDQPALVVPSRIAELLRRGLTPDASAAQVEALMSGAACVAPADATMTAAVATYALSIVPSALSEAVVTGTLACNPDAADAIETAAGPETPTGDVGVADIGAVGGISGAGSQELPRTGSPNQL